MEQYETEPQPSQGDSAREVIRSMIKDAEIMGFKVLFPVSPGLGIETISGGTHEVMKFILNGEPAVTLTEDELKGNHYNEVLFRARNEHGEEVEIRYDSEGNRQTIPPDQQKEHKPEQPNTFRYPKDFPEKIEIKKVVKKLKGNFRARTFPTTDILSASSKSKIAGGGTTTRKAA